MGELRAWIMIHEGQWRDQDNIYVTVADTWFEAVDNLREVAHIPTEAVTRFEQKPDGSMVAKFQPSHDIAVYYILTEITKTERIL